MATPWYLTTAALPLLASLRAHPPRCEARSKSYVQTRDEWATFTGERVDRLAAIRTAAFERAETLGQTEAARAVLHAGVDDVIAALLGTWLPGVHFLSDSDRLAAIRGEIDAALVMQVAA